MKRREFLQSFTALAAGTAITAPAIVVAGQGAIAQRDPAARHRERPEQSRYPRRRHQPAGLRSLVELLRPPHHPREEDACRRLAVIRPRQVQRRARRGHEHRRYVGHLQAEEERQIPGRHAGHRQGRQMVVRARGQCRRLPHRADEGRLAGEKGTVRRGRRLDVPRRLHQEGPAHHSRSRGDRARHLQFRAAQEARHRQGPLGARIHQEQHRRHRRLQGDELEAGR